MVVSFERWGLELEIVSFVRCHGAVQRELNLSHLQILREETGWKEKFQSTSIKFRILEHDVSDRIVRWSVAGILRNLSECQKQCTSRYLQFHVRGHGPPREQSPLFPLFRLLQTRTKIYEAKTLDSKVLPMQNFQSICSRMFQINHVTFFEPILPRLCQ